MYDFWRFSSVALSSDVNIAELLHEAHFQRAALDISNLEIRRALTLAEHADRENQLSELTAQSVEGACGN